MDKERRQEILPDHAPIGFRFRPKNGHPAGDGMVKRNSRSCSFCVFEVCRALSHFDSGSLATACIHLLGKVRFGGLGSNSLFGFWFLTVVFLRTFAGPIWARKGTVGPKGPKEGENPGGRKRGQRAWGKNRQGAPFASQGGGEGSVGRVFLYPVQLRFGPGPTKKVRSPAGRGETIPETRHFWREGSSKGKSHR